MEVNIECVYTTLIPNTEGNADLTREAKAKRLAKDFLNEKFVDGPRRKISEMNKDGLENESMDR